MIGTHKTLLLGFNYETAFIMGTISAVLGGVLRASFSKEFSILASKELYATVAGIGSLLFIALRAFNVETNTCAVITIVVVFILRYGSLKYKIQLPSLNN